MADVGHGHAFGKALFVIQAAEVEQALKLQAEKDRADEERRSARLRGWLALTVATLVALAGLFAYLAPRLGK